MKEDEGVGICGFMVIFYWAHCWPGAWVASHLLEHACLTVAASLLTVSCAGG